MDSKAKSHWLVAAAFSVMATCTPLVFASSDAADVLIEQGTYWQARGDINRAIEAWEKLLLLDQRNDVALQGLVESSIKAKRYAKARAYLDDLKSKYPNSKATPELEQSLRLQESNQEGLLEEARLLAASGNIEEALIKYEELFQGKRPEGVLAREYYGYLGYTKKGLAIAIAELQSLEKQRPNDTELSLLLARHLARQESTRLQGVQRLEKLAQRSDIGSDAAESWRDAILWLGPASREAEPYFKTYLVKHPDDKEVQSLLDQGIAIRSAPPASARAHIVREDPLQKRGQQALSRLEVSPEQAESEFLAILKQRPNDNNALGGLGIIRLREGNLSEAHALLRRASTQNRRGWQQALQQVELQLGINKAQELQKQHLNLDAENIYLKLLRQNPSSISVLSGLVNLLIEQRRLDEARSYLKQLETLMAKETDVEQQANFTLTVARYDIALGDKERAKSDLEFALVRFPLNPWIRLELAQLFLEQNNSYDAENIMRGLDLTTSTNKDVPKAFALFAAATKDWERVVQIVNEMPARNVDTDLHALKDQAIFQQQVAWAKQRCILGQKEDALDSLAQQTKQLTDDITFIVILADAYSACQQTDKSLQLIERQLLIATPKNRVDLNLLKVGLLLEKKEISEVETLLVEVAMQPLNAEQTKSHENFTLYLAIQQAEILLQQGRSAVALKGLTPWLNTHPNHFDLLLMFTRLYMDLGDKAEALKLYKSALSSSTEDQNPTTRVNLARMAYQIGLPREAETILEQLVLSSPHDVELLTHIARLYKQNGRLGRAAVVIQQAMSASQQIEQN